MNGVEPIWSLNHYNFGTKVNSRIGDTQGGRDEQKRWNKEKKEREGREKRKRGKEAKVAARNNSVWRGEREIEWSPSSNSSRRAGA